MSQFKGFSDAARLYAQNFEVVKEMERLFRNDVKAFLDALELEIQHLVAPARFQSRETPALNRYWWLGEPTRGEQPYLWFTNDPRELDHERLIFAGGCDVFDDALHGALAELAANREHGLNRVEGGDRYNAFHGTLKFEQKDAPKAAARRIGQLLLAMNDAYVRMRPEKKD